MALHPFDPADLGFTAEQNQALDQMDLMPEGSLRFVVTFSRVEAADAELNEYVKGNPTGEKVEFKAEDGTLLRVSVGIALAEMGNEEVNTEGFKASSILRFNVVNWNQYDIESLPQGIRDNHRKALKRIRDLVRACDVSVEDENYLAPIAFDGLKGCQFAANNRHFERSDGEKGQFLQNYRSIG